MLDILMKQLGLDPETIKSQVTQIQTAAKSVSDALGRIETGMATIAAECKVISDRLLLLERARNDNDGNDRGTGNRAAGDGETHSGSGASSG